MRPTFEKEIGEPVQSVLNLIFMFLIKTLMCLGAGGN